MCGIVGIVGKTPVAIAAESGHAEALKMIVEAGGNIEAVDQIGGTPLLWAAGLSKNPATLFFLLTCPLFFLLTPHEENSTTLLPDFIPRVCSEFRQRKQPAAAETLAAAVSTGCTPCTRTLFAGTHPRLRPGRLRSCC